MDKIHLGNYKKSRWSFTKKFNLNEKEFFKKNSLLIGCAGCGKTHFLYNLLEHIIKNNNNFLYLGIDNSTLPIIYNISKIYNKNNLVYIKKENYLDLNKIVNKNKNFILETNLFQQANITNNQNDKIFNDIYLSKKNSTPLYIIIDESSYQISKNILDKIQVFNKKEIYFILTYQSGGNLNIDLFKFENFFLFKQEDPHSIIEKIHLNNSFNIRDFWNLSTGQFIYGDYKKLFPQINSMLYNKELHEVKILNKDDMDNLSLKKHLMQNNIENF